MTKAREPDERLSDWVDGRMSVRERERFEAEMRVNKQLMQEAEEFKATVATVQRALRQDPGRADIADRVIAALQQETAPQVRPIRSVRGMSLLFGLSAAAALLLTVVLLQQWQPAVAPPAEQPVADAPVPAPAIVDGFRGADGPKAEARDRANEELDRDAGLRDMMKIAPLAADGDAADAARKDQKGAGDLAAGTVAVVRSELSTPPPVVEKQAGEGQMVEQQVTQPQAPAPTGGRGGGGKAAAGPGSPDPSLSKEMESERAPDLTARKAAAPPATGAAPAGADGGEAKGGLLPPAGADKAADTPPRSILEGVGRPVGNWAQQLANQPVVQTLVVTRQLPLPDREVPRRQAPKKTANEEPEKAGADQTGADEFFLGAAKTGAAAEQTNFLFMSQFVAPPATVQTLTAGALDARAYAQVAGQVSLGSLEVQTFLLDDSLAAMYGFSATRSENNEGRERAKQAQTKAKDDAPALRLQDMLHELAPPQANFARLALVEGSRDEVKKLIADVGRFAAQDQLDFELKELPEAAVDELRQVQRAGLAAGQPRQPAPADPGGQADVPGQDVGRRQNDQAPKGPPPPAEPVPGNDAAVPERMRIIILFRELPPLPRTQKR